MSRMTFFWVPFILGVLLGIPAGMQIAFIGGRFVEKAVEKLFAHTFDKWFHRGAK